MLVLSPVENPPMTLGDAVIGSMDGTWYVGQTKSQNEKKLAWDLSERGINYFLPLETVNRRKPSGQRYTVHRPLFPGYVFFCGDENDRYAARCTNRLIGVIDAVLQNTLRRELADLQLVLQTQPAALKIYRELQVGRMCRIVAGPMEGVMGHLVNRDDHEEFILQVKAMGQSIVVCVDPDLLEIV